MAVLVSIHPVVICLLLVVLPTAISTIFELHRVMPEGTTLHEFKLQDEQRLLQRYHHQDGVASFPLLGSVSHGFYFTKVKIGTPPLEFNLLVETTSHTTWVSCNGCSGCPASNASRMQYNPHKSRSGTIIHCSDKECRPLPGFECFSHDSVCHFASGYLDNTAAKGPYVSDIFHLDMVKGSSETIHSVFISFGCAGYHRLNITQKDTPVDGILALGPADHVSLISQLSSQGVAPNVFSLCLKGGDSGGGKLVLGEIREPGMVYTPLDTSWYAYSLNLQGIALWGQELAIDPKVFGSTVVDTGINLAILAYQAYDIFVSYFIHNVSQSTVPVVANGYQCFQVSGRIDEVFPPVSFNFKEGASMILKPNDYLLFDGSQWCLGFQKVQGENRTILGDLALRGKIIVFDQDRQRLGWKDYDCSQTVHVSVGTHGRRSSLLADQFLGSIFIKIIAFFVYLCMVV